MDLSYTTEQETFRREFREFLGRELALEIAGSGLAHAKTSRCGHLSFERLDRSPDESHLGGALGAGARGVYDSRGCANELDLARALEECLFGHELAAPGDIAEACIGAVRQEVRRGPHGDQHSNRHDPDRDGRGSDDHSPSKGIGVRGRSRRAGPGASGMEAGRARNRVRRSD